MAPIYSQSIISEDALAELIEARDAATENYLRDRMECVILWTQGVSVNKIGRQLGLSHKSVGQWIQSYLDDGLDGLKGKRRGRPQTDFYELSKTITQLLSTPANTEEGWTHATIASALGISIYSVQQTCSRYGISLRNTHMVSFETLEPHIPGLEQLVGFFISSSIQVALFSNDPDLVASPIMKGTFTTKNMILAGSARRVLKDTGKANLSLAQAFTLAYEHASDERRPVKITLQDFLTEVKVAVRNRPLSHAFLWSESGNALPELKSALSHIPVTQASDSEDWLNKVVRVMDGDYNDVSIARYTLQTAFRRFTVNMTDATETFRWIRDVKGDVKLGAPVNDSSKDKADVLPEGPQKLGNPSLVITARFTSEFGMTEEITVSTEDLPRTVDCDLTSLSSIQSFADSLTCRLTPVLDTLGVALGKAVFNEVKCITPLTACRDAEVETLLGRIPITVTGEAVASLQPKERIRSGSYSAVVSWLASIGSFRDNSDILNILSRRNYIHADLVNFNTEYRFVCRIGAQVEQVLSDLVYRDLAAAGILVDDDGAIVNHSAMDAVTGKIGAQTVTVNVDEPLPDSATELEQEMKDFADKYNENKTTSKYMIHGPIIVETGPYLYVCADDIIVHPQFRKKIVFINGRECCKTIVGTSSWISHTVFYIESPQGVYYGEARTQEKAYAYIYAYLIHNHLTDLPICFFMDGAKNLWELTDSLFSAWKHMNCLDYYHVRLALKSFFSTAFRPGKIWDKSKPVEYFNNGKVKKGSMKMVTRSVYYLDKVMSMLWAGNVKEAMDWLKSFLSSAERSEELKPGGKDAIANAIDYLDRKGDKIPCYAMRKHLGLRCTSNSVEEPKSLRRNPAEAKMAEKLENNVLEANAQPPDVVWYMPWIHYMLWFMTLFSGSAAKDAAPAEISSKSFCGLDEIAGLDEISGPISYKTGSNQYAPRGNSA